jgi:hypothetical protein
VLGQVHGHPQLRLPQAKDTRARWGYYHGGQGSAGAGLQIDNIELSAVAVVVAELRELSLGVPPKPLSTAMPSSSGAFKAAKDTKAVQIYAEDPTKIIQIESGSRQELRSPSRRPSLAGSVWHH